MKLAEFFKHDFKKDGLRLYDSNGNQVYHEDSSGFWSKREFDSNSNVTYYENSDGYWSKREYDSRGNETYCEDSYGCWYKQEFDSKGNETYHEDSDGCVRGTSRNSVKKMSVEEIQEQLGYKIEITE